MSQDESLEIYTCGVLTLSDKGSRGEREDTSGLALCELLVEEGYQLSAYEIIPDSLELIARKLVSWVDEKNIDLIITTGGTGVSPGDVTPEATATILDRQIPGISEAMRQVSLGKTIRAVLSRGIAGTRKKSLIINLPGSQKAAVENIEAVLGALKHGLYKIKGGSQDCGAG
jgi:molybdenum cofactor synthesis domain-containing protein